MEFEQKTVKESLNQAFRRDKIERDDFDTSAEALKVLAGKIDQAKKAGETEEHYKTFLDRFLNKSGFNDYYINTDRYTDWVIHNGSKKSDSVGVMIETKKPRGTMVWSRTPGKLEQLITPVQKEPWKRIFSVTGSL